MIARPAAPWASIGVHSRPVCREAFRRSDQASGALVTGAALRGIQRDHFVWLLWHHQAIQATLCSQRRTIKEEGPTCTGHALVMDHSIISNAKVIHVFLLPHISFPAPCQLTSSLHHPPSSLHPPLLYALSPTFHHPAIGRLWMSLGAWAGTKGLCYLKINDSSLR